MSTITSADVKDLGLADEGYKRIVWAERDMPVLRAIRERFEREQPLKGMRMSGRMGVDKQTTQGLRVVRVDAERGLLLIEGAVPGPKGGLVLVRTAGKGA